MDLETAQAAFKYRYVLVIPPERPRGPIWPKKELILAAALFCGLVIGVFGAIAVELREDILSERWQIEQLLELPVLGEVTLAETLREPSNG
jgi:capsular polysaccharide biosynthesis protein